ncbi:MAG: hypothetical protein ACEQSX_03825 [Baekduiaceae bacterium]
MLSLVVLLWAILPGAAHAAVDLAITSLVTNPNPMTSLANPEATVTVTVRNGGDAQATFVSVQLLTTGDAEQIQTVTCPVAFSPSPDPALAVPTSCARGTIQPGETVTMTARIVVAGTSTRVPSFTHTATAFQVTPTGNVPDPTPADNTASETVTVTYDSTLTPDDASSGGGGDGGTTTKAPTVSALTLAPSTFRAAKSGPSAVAARAPIGTVVTTKLSAAAKLTFRVERAAAGRKVGGRCVAPTRRNRSAKACTRWPTMSSRFTADGEAGTNRLRFTGRLGGLRLAPGRYRLVVTPADSRGRVSDPRRAAFRIVS